MLPSKDVNFVGYTYKNFEIVQDANVPGVGKHSKLITSAQIELAVYLVHVYLLNPMINLFDTNWTYVILKLLRLEVHQSLLKIPWRIPYHDLRRGLY